MTHRDEFARAFGFLNARDPRGCDDFTFWKIATYDRLKGCQAHFDGSPRAGFPMAAGLGGDVDHACFPTRSEGRQPGAADRPGSRRAARSSPRLAFYWLRP